MTTTSGSVSATTWMRVPAVLGGADDLDPVERAEQRGEPLAHDLVVVDDDDPDVGLASVMRCSSGAAGRGRRCRPPAGQMTSLRPPSSAARSRRLTRPTPAWTSAGMPTPSSATSTTSAPSATSSRTRGRSGVGVPGDVGHRLARDPEGRDLDRRGQRPEVVGATVAGGSSRSACWRSAPTRPRSSRAGGRRSCTRRRTSATTSCTCWLVAASWAFAAVRVLVDHQPGGLELEDDAAERRAEPVVQVAADPAALLLAGGDQPLPAVLELLGEPAGAGGGGGLADQVAEQLLVAAGQPAAQPARGQHQPADLGVAVGDRQGAGLGRALAVRRDQALAAAAVDLDARRSRRRTRRPPRGRRRRAARRPRRRSRGSRRGRRRRRTGRPGRRAPGDARRARAAAGAGRRAATVGEQHDQHDLALRRVVEQGGEAATTRRSTTTRTGASSASTRVPAQQVVDRDQRRADHATVIATAGSTVNTKNTRAGEHAEVERQGDERRRSRDQGAPQQPAHLLAGRAARSPVAVHDDPDRHQHAEDGRGLEGEEWSAIGASGRSSSGRGRSRAAVGRPAPGTARPSVASAAIATMQTQLATPHAPRGSGPRGRAAGAPRWGSSAVKRARNHSRERHAGQRVLGHAEARLGLREPVEAPEQADPPERPADTRWPGWRSTTPAESPEHQPHGRGSDARGRSRCRPKTKQRLAVRRRRERRCREAEQAEGKGKQHGQEAGRCSSWSGS